MSARTTAETPVSDLPVRAEVLEPWANREVQPLLRQLRKGANAKSVERPDPVFSDGAGTYVTLWTSPELPQDGLWTLVAEVNGVGGSARASYLMVTSIQSIAGVVTPLGLTTVVHQNETHTACDARFAYDATLRTVKVEACDEAATEMLWSLVIQTSQGLDE